MERPARRRLLISAAGSLLVTLLYLGVTRPWDTGPAARITVSREATVFTGPIRADGTVDYVAALDHFLGQGVADDDNAVVPMLEALGPDLIDGEGAPAALRALAPQGLTPSGDSLMPLRQVVEQWAEVHPTDDELALPVETPESRQWDRITKDLTTGTRGSVTVGPDAPPRGEIRRDRRAKRVSALVERVIGLPWSSDEYPFLAQYLDDQADRLSLVERASLRPNWYVPVTVLEERSGLAGSTMCRLQVLRGAAELLQARAMRKVACGDAAGAWADSAVIHRLARLAARDLRLVQFAMSLALEDAALQTDFRIAVHGELPQEDREGLRRSLRLLPPFPDARRALDFGERVIALDCLMRVIGPTGPGVIPDLMVARANARFDAVVSAYGRATLAERVQGDREATEEFERTREARLGRHTGIRSLHRFLESPRERREEMSLLLTDVALAIALPDMAAMARAETELLARRRLVEFALESRGRPPSARQELPEDPFTGRPMRVREVGEGTCVYSVGQDLNDDGGDPRRDVCGTFP